MQMQKIIKINFVCGGDGRATINGNVRMQTLLTRAISKLLVTPAFVCVRSGHKPHNKRTDIERQKANKKIKSQKHLR